jgi:hypothetical protein
MPQLITLEEHYLCADALQWGRNKATYAKFPGLPTSKLLSQSWEGEILSGITSPRL